MRQAFERSRGGRFFVQPKGGRRVNWWLILLSFFLNK